MRKFIDDLDFTNVKIDEEESDKDFFVIDFTLKNEFNFYIVVNCIDGSGIICHYSTEEYICPFCEKNDEFCLTVLCQELTVHFEDIKAILLNHSRVRLKRLFL